jgi:hypothetical protein
VVNYFDLIAGLQIPESGTISAGQTVDREIFFLDGVELVSTTGFFFLSMASNQYDSDRNITDIEIVKCSEAVNVL